MIQVFGVTGVVCGLLAAFLENWLLIRVWTRQPDWADQSNFHEPSWVTRSARRRWAFFLVIIRADRHLRTNSCDTLLLVGIWVTYALLIVSLSGLIYCLASGGQPAR